MTGTHHHEADCRLPASPTTPVTYFESAPLRFPSRLRGSPTVPQGLSSVHSVPVLKNDAPAPAPPGPERTRRPQCLTSAAFPSRCSTLHEAALQASFCFPQIQFQLATAVTAERVITLQATLVQTAAAAQIVSLFFQIHQSLGERKTLLPQGRHQTVPVPFSAASHSFITSGSSR